MTSHPNFDRTQAALNAAGQGDYVPRHADPRTTVRYDRARNNLGRHPNYILAAYTTSAT